MITKTTMVVIFNLQNSHSLTFSFPTEEVFQVNGQNRPVANLPVVDFHSQPREMLTPKPLNTQLSVFLLVYWFSSPSPLNLIVCQRYGFFSVLATMIQESSDKQLVMRIVKAFEWRQRRVTYKQLIGYINTREKIRCFFKCVVTAFLGAGIPV